MKDQELIDFILGIKTLDNRKSCLQMALTTARRCVGKNPKTGKGDAASMNYVRTFRMGQGRTLDEAVRNGEFNEYADDDLFAGLTFYLIALEQIGLIFKTEDIKCDKTNGIKRALTFFGDNLKLDEITAIYNLRNTLVHNSGLATEGKKDKNKFTLLFNTDETDWVKLPQQKWDGNYDDKSEETSTQIEVYALCNLVESIVTKIIKSCNAGKLLLHITNNNETLARFTLIV